MKWINIYNDCYAVSDTGLVKANKRNIYTKTGVRHYKERILVPETTKDGHLRVTLSVNNKKQRFFVHRLVAENFLPNPQNLPVINHKDENPKNNNVNNLEWCSIAYNNVYNNRHLKIGDSEGYNVLIFNKNGKFIEELPSISAFSRKYNFSLSTSYRRAKDNLPIGNYFLELKEVKNEKN